MNKNEEKLVCYFFDCPDKRKYEAAKFFWSSCYMPTPHECNIEAEATNQRLATADMKKTRTNKKTPFQKPLQESSYYESEAFRKKAIKVMARKKEDEKRMMMFRFKRTQLELASCQKRN